MFTKRYVVIAALQVPQKRSTAIGENAGTYPKRAKLRGETFFFRYDSAFMLDHSRSSVMPKIVSMEKFYVVQDDA